VTEAGIMSQAADRERWWAVWCHLWVWTFVSIVVAPLVLRNRAAHGDLVTTAAVDAANLQIAFLGTVVLLGVGFVVLPNLALIVLFAVLCCCNGYCYAVGAVGAWKAFRGQVWRYPWTPRLVRDRIGGGADAR
jgi:uncharacterized Tic20 family protein